jgi:hypothetical protein
MQVGLLLSDYIHVAGMRAHNAGEGLRPTYEHCLVQPACKRNSLHRELGENMTDEELQEMIDEAGMHAFVGAVA